MPNFRKGRAYLSFFRLRSGVEFSVMLSADVTHETPPIHFHPPLFVCRFLPSVFCSYSLCSALRYRAQVVESWSVPIDAPQNMFIVSIPTVLDPSLAPKGKHLVHIYTAGNEPYKLWEGMKRGSPEYEVRYLQRCLTHSDGGTFGSCGGNENGHPIFPSCVAVLLHTVACVRPLTLVSIHVGLCLFFR